MANFLASASGIRGSDPWKRITRRIHPSYHVVSTLAIILMVILCLAVLAGGAVIALLASRSAPEGFEDQEGFHTGRAPNLSPRRRRSRA